jgi:hypothetical protein
VKFVFETSKKTFATASTFTRAVVVSVLGSVTTSVPSFDVFAASTVGYVCPPSVESEIFTFAVETGGSSVPAVFQVTVCCEPGGYVTAVSGAVTRNGPAVGASVSVTSPMALPPRDREPSCGSASPSVCNPRSAGTRRSTP